MPVFKTHNILSNVFHVQYSMAKEATSGVICKFKRDFCSETYYGERLVNGFKALTIFEKKFHLRYSTGLQIRLWITSSLVVLFFWDIRTTNIAFQAREAFLRWEIRPILINRNSYLFTSFSLTFDPKINNRGVVRTL